MDEQVTSRGGSESAEETLRPYRHLAMRILALALLDLSNPAGLPADRESARLFLKGSRMLSHWCRVAAVEPSCMVRLAEKLGAGPHASRA